MERTLVRNSTIHRKNDEAVKYIIKHIFLNQWNSNLSRLLIYLTQQIKFSQ